MSRRDRVSMGQLSTRDRRTLREMLEGLLRPVEILAFVRRDHDTDLVELLAEVAALGRDRLVLRIVDEGSDPPLEDVLSVTDRPSLRFLTPGGEVAPIEVVGSPSGYQFGAFVNLVLSLSRGRAHVPHSINSGLKSIARNVLLEVLTTPTCPHSPQVVRLAQECALANPGRIFARSIDAVQHSHLVPSDLDVVPYLRLWVEGRVVARHAGMLSDQKLWHLIQTGAKGASWRDASVPGH